LTKNPEPEFATMYYGFEAFIRQENSLLVEKTPSTIICRRRCPTVCFDISGYFK
jgi:hypothetical protein